MGVMGEDGENQRRSSGARLRALLTSIFIRGPRHGGDLAAPACQPMPEPIATDANRLQPVSAGEHQVGIYCQIPTRRWVTPAEHAAAILEFLQGPGGRTGSIPVDDLKKLHIEICFERDWELIGWTAVGRELRNLLGAQKCYDWVEGRRVRVYRIPPSGTGFVWPARSRAA
jgi:hypothetical protein